MNILLNNFSTNFNTSPFQSIKNEDYKPAILKLIEDTKLEIEAIVNNTETPTFENTIEALEFSGQQLDRVTSIFFNLNSAETNDDLQKIAQDISPILTEFGNDITLNEALFKKVKHVYDNKDRFNLNTEQSTLLDKKYKSFSRNGANLSEDKKQQLRALA